MSRNQSLHYRFKHKCNLPVQEGPTLFLFCGSMFHISGKCCVMMTKVISWHLSIFAPRFLNAWTKCLNPSSTKISAGHSSMHMKSVSLTLTALVVQLIIWLIRGRPHSAHHVFGLPRAGFKLLLWVITPEERWRWVLYPRYVTHVNIVWSCLVWQKSAADQIQMLASTLAVA